MKFLLILLILLGIENIFSKEVIGNQNLKDSDELYSEKAKQEKSISEHNREKEKYFASIGLPSGIQKLSVISVGYHLSSKFSIGTSINFTIQNDWDYKSLDSLKYWNKGIIPFIDKTTYQQGAELVPNLGGNLFLHYFPLSEKNFPFYIPFYLGRSNYTTVSSGEFLLANNQEFESKQNSIYSYKINYMPSIYIGSGFGLKIQNQLIHFGLEFGYVKMLNSKFDIFVEPSLLNLTQITVVEYFFANSIFENSFQPGTNFRLNYGILIGINF